jgi:hypothetical protein
MDNALSAIQNKALAKFIAGAPADLINSIQKASHHTGVNFAYLVKQAKVESSFNPTAKAKTSSATGLYQFIESTWLSMVKRHGEKYGLGDLADQISDKGKVADINARKEILALRKDPEIASIMAAELANENKEFLEQNWGGKVGSTEMYLAHFMGASGATGFLKARDDNPLQAGAVLFPDAAKANRNIFYDTSTGRARSLDQIYAFFDRKFDIEGIDIDQVTTQTQTKENIVSAANISNIPNFEKNIISTAFIGDGKNIDKGYSGFLGGFKTGNLITNPIEILMLSQLELPGQRRAELR